MNRSERDAMLGFLQPLMRTRAADKDFAAESLILDACARQPDALYLLVQRAMALQSALQAAQARLAELTAAQATQAAPADAASQGVTAQGVAAPGAWSRGLLAQVAAVGAGAATGAALGAVAGVVAGSLLLDGMDAPDGADVASGLGGLLDGLG